MGRRRGGRDPRHQSGLRKQQRSRSWRGLVVTCVVFAVAASALWLITTTIPADGESGEPGIEGVNSKEAAVEEAVHERINEIRKDRDLSTLAYDESLAEIALDHSEDMAKDEYFSHREPGGDGIEERYAAAGYECRVKTGEGQYSTGAENIYKVEADADGESAEEIADDVVSGWMGSEGHRKNILQSYWKNEGIGVAIVDRGDEVEAYVTQNFC